MKRKIIYSILIGLVFLLMGCNTNYNTSTVSKENEKKHSGFIAMTPGIYDSADKAVLIAIHKEEKKITFKNLETGKYYTLNYDGTTKVRDKYDQEIALSQIKEGSIVENKFFKSKKALAYLAVAKDAFSFEEIQNYSFLPQNNQMVIGANPYSLGGNISILSEGSQLEAMDINKTDRLDVYGIGNTIYSIVVARGHGYLRLKNEEAFVGGWIEVGQTVIKEVKKDMLIVVPEGTYQVRISKDGNEANQTITFTRDEEMIWNLGTVPVKEVKKGSFIFTVHPMEAKVLIDGKEVDTSKPFETEYGVHQLEATAEGYDTITQYVKLNDEYANIDITMNTTKEEEALQENTSSQDAKEETKAADSSVKKEENDSKTESEVKEEQTAENYRVYINSPTGVEVYLDGNYIGITPVDFKKEVGNYVLSLRKKGFQTRSYNISVENDHQDSNYSFTNLLELDE